MSHITTDLNLALERLHQQDVVAIPTETVYGLAADASTASAVRKIYTLKNRPLNHPLIMHVAPSWDLERWVRFIPDYAYKLMQACWPGPLTLVFSSRQGSVLSSITGGQDTVAVRAPQHPMALALLTQWGQPLVAPSANRFGKISPTTATHVAESFPEEDVLILDGGRCDVGIESTIILATDPHHCTILRHGLIDEDFLQQCTGHAALPSSHPVRVSGAMAQHYQPNKPLFYFEKNTSYTPSSEHYFLYFSSEYDRIKHNTYHLSHDPARAAYELYYQLRHADTSNATAIFIELPPALSGWQGLRDRIMKAGVPL